MSLAWTRATSGGDESDARVCVQPVGTPGVESMRESEAPSEFSRNTHKEEGVRGGRFRLVRNMFAFTRGGDSGDSVRWSEWETSSTSLSL